MSSRSSFLILTACNIKRTITIIMSVILKLRCTLTKVIFGFPCFKVTAFKQYKNRLWINGMSSFSELLEIVDGTRNEVSPAPSEPWMSR